MNNQFAEDVREGLSSKPKYLHSKYFYDEIGDKIFQRIMSLEEYYLTNCEYDIFLNQKTELLKYFSPEGERFDLIEFGAGDGLKTKVLIEYFVDQKVDFKYIPIDISQNVLKNLTTNLKEIFPTLQIHAICDDYFHALEDLNKVDFDKKIILFLGSNIGNFSGDNAIPFLRHIAADMSQNDILLIGFDLKKDPVIILEAYNDKQGVTRDFNLNLLKRINKELDADFDIKKFKHYPTYNPQTGETKSYLICLEDMVVKINALHQTFTFYQWEPIFTEVSQKYSMSDIKRLADNSGFKIKKHFFDHRNYYTDSLWVLK